MTALRTDIQKALDELISNEEGMKFQGLAVVLARHRWPDLIACERKKDMGADAIAKVAFSAEGTGKVLACSTTASIKKIRSDAEKVKSNFKDITKIIFATPSPVSNEVGEQWVTEIKNDFGFDLAIMPREDIIMSLIEPKNITLLRSYLGIQVDIQPELSDLVKQVREAAAEVTETWFKRIADKPLIALHAARLNDKGQISHEVLRLEDLRSKLLLGERIMLEAPAGRGKTTTLIQIAKMPTAGADTSFLLDLTAWISTHGGILQFIAGMPQFQRRGLDAATLARVNTVEHFSFLLNGWNEIGEPEFPHAENALRTLERDFSAAGIVVATRNHHIVPPLPGATRARLRTLTKRERSSYLKKRLGGRADQLRLKLDGDPVLDELTRTPFFLSEVTSIFEAEIVIPSTKIGVLDAVTRLVEQSDEHRNALRQSPVFGQSPYFLSGLAFQMTAQNAASISEKNARSAIATGADFLKGAGQIGTTPEPGSVLGALCAHHVLERDEYPEVTFRFQHQQFQEFYAALSVRRQLFALRNSNEDQKLEFSKSFVNEPAWAEPLRLLADDIRGRTEGPDPISAFQMGVLLITMALHVDPVFGAELAQLCGAHVWKGVRTIVNERLRSLYASGNKNNQQCAVVGMVATGSDDFKDIIEPVLSGDAQQTFVGIHRSWDIFHLSSLGPDWRKTVSGWAENSRTAFISRLLHNRNVPELVDYALSDESTKVKQAALEGLTWIGAEDDAARFLNLLKESDFDLIVGQMDPEDVPASLRSRAAKAAQDRHATETDPLTRLDILLKWGGFGAHDFASRLKEELAKVTGQLDNHRAHYVVKPALDIIRVVDNQWVSHWVAEKIAAGALWHETWKSMIASVPEKLKNDLLGRLEGENFNHAPFGSILSVLAAVADGPMVERIFAKLCDLRRTITLAPEKRHEFEWAIERQLETLMRELPVGISVSGVSRCFSEPLDLIELSVITRVFSRVARQGAHPLAELDSKAKGELRSYVMGALPFVLQQEDFSGEIKADVNSVLSSVGASEDLKEMCELIQADIERLRKGREARARGDCGKRGNGGSMSYSNWHIRSLVALDPVNAEPVLLGLLKDSEYEREVTAEFVRQTQPQPIKGLAFEKPGYEGIWEARRERPLRTNHERRSRYAAALKAHIGALLQENASPKERRPLEFRLRMLGAALAKIDGAASADLVFKVMSMPDEWDNYPRLEAFSALLSDGVVLPTEPTLALIEPCLQRWRKFGVYQQDEWLLKQFLCLLPFVEDPQKGIGRLRALLSEIRVYGHQLQGILTAVGHSRCDSALPFLLEFASDKTRVEHLGDEWINAVAAVDTADAQKVLLSFVDPAQPGLVHDIKLHREDVLVARIVDLARRDKSVEERLLSLCDIDLPPPKRALLAKVVGQLRGVEAASAGLNLIDDALPDRVPYEVWKQLEDAFIERRPHGDSQNTYTLEPRNSNAIRAKLLDMAAKDPRRKKSASGLLAQIEVWRLEYGRPVGEPRHPALASLDAWPPKADSDD